MPIGRYFEEFRIGEEFVTPGRTIFEAGAVNLAYLSGDHNDIHTNAEQARRLGLPGPVPYVNVVIAMVAGLIQRLAHYDGPALRFVAMG